MGRKGGRKTFEAQETVMDPDVEARTSTQVIGADMRFSGYTRKSTGETVIEVSWGPDYTRPCMLCEGVWSLSYGPQGTTGKILAGVWTSADLHFRKISLAAPLLC